MFWIATTVVSVGLFGALVAVAAKARGRAAAVVDERTRAAFEQARVDVIGVKRLSLADVDRVEPGNPELPYVFYIDVTVSPAREFTWDPSELDVVSDQVEAPAHGKMDFELVRVRVDTVSGQQSVRRLEVTVRSRRSTPAYRFLYHGIVFGRVETFGAMVIGTQSSVTTLIGPRGGKGTSSSDAPKKQAASAFGSEREHTHPAERVAQARQAAEEPPAPARVNSAPPRPDPEREFELETELVAPTARDAEVAFSVFSVTGDAFELPPIEGLDGEAFQPLARSAAPERFDLDTLTASADGPIPPILVGALFQSQFVYRVIVRRSATDLSHVASALTTAASIAIACRGVIIDMITGQWLTHAQARSVLKSPEFSIADHVVVRATPAMVGQTLRTHGLVKFGCAECIALDVPNEHVNPVRDAMLAIANHRSLGGPIDAGVTLKIGEGFMSLMPGRDGDLILTDASAQPGSPRGVLRAWLAASTVPPAKSATHDPV